MYIGGDLSLFCGATGTPVWTWFPHRLENLETWENIFQSGNSEYTGKVREFYTKYWKSWWNLHKLLEKSENFRQLLYFLFFMWFEFLTIFISIFFCEFLFNYLKKKNCKKKKNHWKMEKDTGKVRENCQSDDVGTMFGLRMTQPMAF